MTTSSNSSRQRARQLHERAPLRRILLVLACPLLLLGAAAPGIGVTLKLASIFPEGSVWDKSFRQMGADWKKGGAPSVALRVYPGGVAGDEPDILRKMRIGQLHAACLTVSGLAEIDEAFGFFQIPLFFDSYQEVMYVLGEMESELKERLEEKGFVLIHWGHGGWIHLFSKTPVRTIDDLRSLKQFTWAGDTRMEAWWRRNGFRPVPLAATDIPTGLETGLIEVVPGPPLAVLSLQWFRSTKFMLDRGFLPYLGATIVTKRAWKKLSAEERVAVLAAGEDAQQFLFDQVPVLEKSAIAEMTKRGLEATQLTDGLGPWEEVSASFAAEVERAIEGDFFERATAARDAFRERGE